MNKNILNISILIATSLWTSQLMAGSVTVPNTFTGGTTASASEVNANFGALKTAVDDNDARVTTNASDINSNALTITDNTNAISAAVPQVQLKDANGTYIGRVIGMSAIAGPFVLTDQGYRTNIAIGQGSVIEIANILYESSSCTGPAYVAPKKHIGSVFLREGLDHASAYAAGVFLYVHNDATKITINAYSNQMGPCVLLGPVDVYPASLNDPIVTGIQNTLYPTRMLIE